MFYNRKQTVKVTINKKVFYSNLGPKLLRWTIAGLMCACIPAFRMVTSLLLIKKHRSQGSYKNYGGLMVRDGVAEVGGGRQA